MNSKEASSSIKNNIRLHSSVAQDVGYSLGGNLPSDRQRKYNDTLREKIINIESQHWRNRMFTSDTDIKNLKKGTISLMKLL